MRPLATFVSLLVLGAGIAGAVAVSGHRVAANQVWVPQTGWDSLPGGGFGGVSFATRDACLADAQAADGSDACTEESLATVRPGWVLPAAILIGFLGLAGGAGIFARAIGSRASQSVWTEHSGVEEAADA